MKPSILFLVSLGVLVGSFSLTFGLTYVKCYSAICVEDHFPENVRIHLASFYAFLLLAFIVLSLRRLYPAFETLLSKHLICRPLPLLSARLSVGGLLTTIWLAYLLGGSQGYFVGDQLSFYRSRALAAANTTLGTTRLAAVGATGHLCDILLGLVILPIARTSTLNTTFRLSPSTLLRFHTLTAYLFLLAVLLHTAFFYAWVPVYARGRPPALKDAFGIDNPTLSQSAAEEDGIYAQSVLASGMLALGVFVAIVATSLPARRRKRWNTFYATHLLSALFFVLVCVHASTDFYCLLPGLLLWGVDWGCRARGLRTEAGARLQREGNGWFRLVVPAEGLGGAAGRELEGAGRVGKPLVTWYLRVGRVSRWQVHPFTAARMGGGEVVFLWRVPRIGKGERREAKEWTARLARLVAVECGGEGGRMREEDVAGTEMMRLPAGLESAARGDEIAAMGLPGDAAGRRLRELETASRRLPSIEVQMRLEGPYVSHHSPFGAYKSVLCVVGGTGITGALSLAESFLVLKASESSTGDKDGFVTRHFGIVWSIRESENADLIDVDVILTQATAAGVPILFNKHLTGPGRQRMEFSSTIKQFVDASEAGDKSEANPDGPAWVYFSGPTAFMAAGEVACVDVRRESQRSSRLSLDWYCAKRDV